MRISCKSFTQHVCKCIWLWHLLLPSPCVANCILRSVCQFFARPNCAFNLSVFHARISCPWFFRMEKVNDLRNWVSLVARLSALIDMLGICRVRTGIRVPSWLVPGVPRGGQLDLSPGNGWSANPKCLHFQPWKPNVGDETVYYNHAWEKIHNGLLANNVLSITLLALNKGTSILPFVLKPCCSSGWNIAKDQDVVRKP